jgi:glycosyltransferase involved in cell wall biosynthesis
MLGESATRPTVSVLINTYNHEEFIEQAILSALEQDFPTSETEIVVVDDGSSDKTQAVIEKLARTTSGGAGSRFRYIRKENGGQASAFNVGIPETHGELLAFLDGDDWWDKRKLSAVVETFAKNPDVAAVGHGFYGALSHGQPRELVVPEHVWVGLRNVEETKIATALKSFLATSKLTVRRRVLERLGPIPKELVFCADEPIMDTALALGGAILLDRPLAYYRCHSGNLFGVESWVPARSENKYNVEVFLTRYLPNLFARFGVSQQSIEILTQTYWLDIQRYEALYRRGGRWQAFQAEWRSFREEYKNPSLGYWVFKGAVAMLTLLLSPAHFYKIRAWYGKRNLRRFREGLGNAEMSLPQLYKRVPLVDRN